MEENQYRKLLDKRRKEYKSFVPAYCSALREYIFKNSNGFNHLMFRVDGSPRKPTEQMYKMGLLPLVLPALHSAVTVDRYERRLSPVGRKKKNGRKILKEAEYWALVAVVGRRSVKIRVVVRKIGKTGKIHFWSVMKLSENQKAPNE